MGNDALLSQVVLLVQGSRALRHFAKKQMRLCEFLFQQTLQTYSGGHPVLKDNSRLANKRLLLLADCHREGARLL